VKSLFRAVLGLLFFLLVWGGVFAALEWKLQDRFAPPGDWIGGLLMSFFVALSLGAFVKSRQNRGDAVLAAEETAELRDGARIAVLGTLKPVSATLRSPFSGEDCVAYEYEIKHFVHKDSRQVGSSSWSMDRSGMALVPCIVRGAVRDVRLMGYPAFQNLEWKDVEDKDAVRRYVEQTSFERSGIVAGLATIDARQAEVRKDWRVTDYDDLDSSKVTELVVRPGPVCAIGHYSAAENALVPGSGRGLRIIAGTPDEARRYLGAAGLSGLLGAAALLLFPLAIFGVLVYRESYFEKEGRGHSLREIRHEQLLEAASAGSVDDMRRLLAHGAEVDGRDPDGSTSLARVPSPAAAQLLLDAGADVNAANHDGFTPLMRAAASGNVALVRLLLGRGAALERQDTQYRLTAEGFAELNNQGEAAEVLREARAKH
jgi:hypothetical protein